MTDAEKALEKVRQEREERRRQNRELVAFDFEVPGWRPALETAEAAASRIRLAFAVEIAAFEQECELEVRRGSAT